MNKREYENNDKELGKTISYILRHHPEAFDIKMDSHGWVNVDELIKNMCKSGKIINHEILDRIVMENNKMRYSYNENKTKIRANQGHSVPVDLELLPVNPPDMLYHGTAENFLDSIYEKGILKMSRNHVHLSGDIETAFNVGNRHGKPIVLVIDTEKMIKNNIKFYLSENKVWLCDYVPFKYISAILRKKGGELCTEKL